MFSWVIDFAKETGLTQWDWAAIMISLIASIVSIVIAFKTLKSQIKTQANTAQLIKDAGYEYLKTYMPSVIISYMHLTIFYNIKISLHNKYLKEHLILHDYDPYLFYHLTLPKDGIKPDQFISYPEIYNMLYSLNGLISSYNEHAIYFKKRVTNNERPPVQSIENAKFLLRSISSYLIEVVKIIKSTIEKSGESLTEDEILNLRKQIDLNILEVFYYTFKNYCNTVEVHSKELDERVFDDKILEIIKDSKIKRDVKYIYISICRLTFFNCKKFFRFKFDEKLNEKLNEKLYRSQQIEDEIRTLYYLGECDNALRKINSYFIEDINNIGRYALEQKEDVQDAYFNHQLKKIRKFYDHLYECINRSAPQSFEDINLRKWNSFNCKQELPDYGLWKEFIHNDK